jgi:hypothetical protein
MLIIKPCAHWLNSHVNLIQVLDSKTFDKKEVFSVSEIRNVPIKEKGSKASNEKR